jgi:hypothetical protein
MRLPARAMLTGVSANRRRPWAHLPRSPGITVRLANLRRLIDPSASRTRLHSKRSGWKTKFHQPDFLMALPALRVLWRSLLLRARASVCPYTIIASCITAIAGESTRDFCFAVARESNRKAWPRDSRDRHRQLRVFASSSVRSPDTNENWRKMGPIAARRGKSFAGRSTMFESTRLLPAWGDNPKIRSYIEIVEFV